MIVLNLKDITDKINRKNYKVATIYEGHARDYEDKNTFEILEETSPEKLAEGFKILSESYPGKFTVLLSEIRTTPRLKQDLVFVQFDRVGASATNLNGSQDFEEMKKKWKEEIKEDLKRQEKEREREDELKETKEKLKYLETTGGKLANVTYKFLLNIQEGYKMKKALQGGGERFDRREKQETKNTKSMTDLETALGHLVNVLGEDLIMKMAVVLEENDPVIPTIEHYVDSKYNEKNPKKEKSTSMNGSEKPIGKKRFY